MSYIVIIYIIVICLLTFQNVKKILQKSKNQIVILNRKVVLSLVFNVRYIYCMHIINL